MLEEERSEEEGSEEESQPYTNDHQLFDLMASLLDLFVSQPQVREPGETMALTFVRWLADLVTTEGMKEQVLRGTRISEEIWDWMASAPHDPAKLMTIHRMIEHIDAAKRPEPQHRMVGVMLECVMVYADGTATILNAKFEPPPGMKLVDGMLIPNLRQTVNEIVDVIASEGIDGLKSKSVPINIPPSRRPPQQGIAVPESAVRPGRIIIP